MFLPSITPDEINRLPLAAFNGRAVIISSPEKLTPELIDHFNRADIIGFDTETKPSFQVGKRHKTALLQISTDTTALLIKLQQVGLPIPIAELLENPNITKVGAAVKEDIRGLQKFRNFEPHGFIDLQQLVPVFNIQDKSVRKLTAIILGRRISKSMQLSNWENANYSEPQISYAATDAWICRRMLLELQRVAPEEVKLWYSQHSA